MDSNDQKLAHSIKMKFGTSPNEPNQQQLDGIKKVLQALISQGIRPTENKLAEIVRRYCPDAGSHHYAGEDNSDLVTLLLMAINKNRG